LGKILATTDDFEDIFFQIINVITHSIWCYAGWTWQDPNKHGDVQRLDPRAAEEL